MIQLYFRCQRGHYTLKQMQNFVSGDGGDGGEKGVCAIENNGWFGKPASFGGAWDSMSDDDEVVVLEGRLISEIYDGVRIYPTKIVATYTCKEWTELHETGKIEELYG